MMAARRELQAQVHKLRLCTSCYPSYNAHKGNR